MNSEQLAAISNLSSVFSDSTSILTNFKNAVASIGNPAGLSFNVNATINDSDITVNVDVRLKNKIKENVPQLSPLLLLRGPNNMYTTDLKDSILKLDISDGSTTLLATLPPTLQTYDFRGIRPRGISNDGLYLTAQDVYAIAGQQGNTPVNYIYRVNTTTGVYAKVILFDLPIDVSNRTWYNPFTDSVYWDVNNNQTNPIKYQFTGLNTYTKTTSSELFPPNGMQFTAYINTNNICYYRYETITESSIKRWNTTTGAETNVITLPYKIREFGQGNYDNVTDTVLLNQVSGYSDCFLIKNISGSATLDKTINTPITAGQETAMSYNISGNTFFVVIFDRPCFNALTAIDNYWKCYTVYKIQNNIIAPFTCFDTT